MRKKMNRMAILFFLFSLLLAQKSFAKYVIKNILEVNFYLDKTSPIIQVTSSGKKESFQKSKEDVIPKVDNIIVDTSDNVEIEYNEYSYHPKDNNFDEVESRRFENGQEFTEEGYYEIIAVDTSGNQTKIVILLDKSAPDVLVQYFRKGQANADLSQIRQCEANRKYFMTENTVESDENLEEKSDELIEETEEPKQPEIGISEEITQIELETEEQEISEENTEETHKDIIENTEEMSENEIKNHEVMEETIEEIETIEAISIEEKEAYINQENEIMLLSATNIYVGNETEFRNALAMQIPVIHVRQSIDFSAPIYINYTVTIMNEGTSNSLRYGNGGNFITVQNGGSLTLQGMVVDTNSSGVGGMTGINIESGGWVIFVNGSIVDGGLGNTGILVNSGSNLLLWSCRIVRCNLGINLQGNGNLVFGKQEDNTNKLYWNNIAIYIDNFYGNCIISENIYMYDNSPYGIYIEKSSGNIQILAGQYYQNTYAIHTCHITSGSITVSGGSYYSNGWAIWVGGNLTLADGLIYNNYYGILTDSAYEGNFYMTGGSIYNNTGYAICHGKTNDGGCTITGGSILGEVYLEKNDNYINTNSSYPTFTVTPSSYYFKRKLVKSTNHLIANSEIWNITLTPKDAWYKYVDEEFIVLWSGGNVVVRCLDYNGNSIKQEVVNGTIGTEFSITAPMITNYDLISDTNNVKGIFSQENLVVDFQYDLVKIAKVTFEDLLSGVISAKYWYSANEEKFSGNGSDFTNGTIFENYGYYKIIVENGVGLEKEVIFQLNKDSQVQ